MRPLTILACLVLLLTAVALSAGGGLGTASVRAQTASDAARSSLARDVELAERAQREARRQKAEREARRQQEEAERAALAEEARRAEQTRQAEEAARQETQRRNAALKMPPLPRRAPQEMEEVLAEEASDWQPGHRARVRMIAGDIDFSRGWSYAGVQIELASGWKTYWRSPGDTGVPPTFDWSGSRNLKSAEVLYPAPRKYEDAYSTSVGYKHEVVLPVRLTAVDPSKPVEVRLRFGYGLCEEICVPGEAELELVMPPRRNGRSDTLTRYTRMVPKRVERLGQSAEGFAIEKVDVALDGDTPAITIDARVPAGIDSPDLFIEASDDFYLPLPSEEQADIRGLRRYRIDLTRGDTPARLAGRTLSVTLVGDSNGIEYRHKIN